MIFRKRIDKTFWSCFRKHMKNFDLPISNNIWWQGMAFGRSCREILVAIEASKGLTVGEYVGRIAVGAGRVTFAGMQLGVKELVFQMSASFYLGIVLGCMLLAAQEWISFHWDKAKNEVRKRRMQSPTELKRELNLLGFNEIELKSCVDLCENKGFKFVMWGPEYVRKAEAFA